VLVHPINAWSLELVFFFVVLQPHEGYGLLIHEFFFLENTWRRATIGRTPLDEWSVRRRDLYLTTHNTHNRNPCPRRDSSSQSQQASGRRPTSYTIRPLGPASLELWYIIYTFICSVRAWYFSFYFIHNAYSGLCKIHTIYHYRYIWHLTQQ
jgi:hypothetical protein